MFKKHTIKSYIAYSIIAAILYSITAYVFIHKETFNYTWILYMGNAFFGCCIVAFIILYNKKRKENASTETMIVAGHITTVIGIIIACIITLLLYLFIPEQHAILQSDVLNNAPPQMESGGRHQFLLSLFMNAVIGNVSTGSFVSLIIPYAAKQDQKGDTSIKSKDEPNLLNENKS